MQFPKSCAFRAMLTIAGFVCALCNSSALAKEPTSPLSSPPVPAQLEKTPVQRAPAGRQPPASNRQAPLTNADVIRMVNAGTPAPAIIASIRSGAGAFDLSNKARSDLFGAGGTNRAREMTEIWNAMIAKATNGRGGDEVSTEATIQKTSPAAIGATQTMGSQAKSATPAVPQKGGTAALPPRSGTPSAPSRTATQPLSNSASVAVICGQDSTFRILGMSGAADRATFMPGGQYIIWGCSFGNPSYAKTTAHSPSQPQNSVSIQPVSTLDLIFQNAIAFDVKSWSDNSIVVAVNASYGTGTLSPATLFVHRADGQQTSKDGFLFKDAPAPPTKTCAQDNTLRIINISGKQGEGVFFYPGSHYILRGCGFGQNPGAVEIRGLNFQEETFIVKLHIEMWSDNEIQVTFGGTDVTGAQLPNGVGDSATLTLWSSGRSTQFSVYCIDR